METLITANNVQYSVSSKMLFEDLTFSIVRGDRIGLVGHNGSGKTTLLHILDRSLAPDSGSIAYRNNMTIETVEQFLPVELEDMTLYDCVLAKLHSDEYHTNEYLVELALEDLGFSRDEFGYRLKDLSGGQKNRLMFARAVINEPDIVLFDEPTNHMDVPTMLFFEHYLKNVVKCTYIIISHDRRFLDRVSDRTFFLRDERIYSFDMPYSGAREALAEMDEIARRRRKNEEKEIKRLKEAAKRLSTWGKVYDNEDLSKRAKDIEKRVDRLQENKTFVTRGNPLNLQLDFKDQRSKFLIQVENDVVSFSKDNFKTGINDLFKIQQFYIKKGDRVALLGANGVGKTTFVRKLIHYYHHEDERPQRFIFNPQVCIGYYDQEQEQFSVDATIFSTIRDMVRGGTDHDLRKQLIAAGFPYDDHFKKIGTLSGGEKARIMFLIQKINRPNFLILDEPTNHIDIDGKEQLEREIIESGATVLMTSHDRVFVENIATRYWLIDGGELFEIGDPQEFYNNLEFEKGTAGKRPVSEREQAVGNIDNIDNIDKKKNLEADDLLEKILHLEERLKQEEGRKKKHKKPQLIAKLQEELVQLNHRLDAHEQSSH